MQSQISNTNTLPSLIQIQFNYIAILKLGSFVLTQDIYTAGDLLIFTYIVVHPESEKYLEKYFKYFPMYLYLNNLECQSICI